MSSRDLTWNESSVGPVTSPEADEAAAARSQAELGNWAARDLILAHPRGSVALVVGREPRRVLALLQPPLSPSN
jgi:hypothetical protein